MLGVSPEIREPAAWAIDEAGWVENARLLDEKAECPIDSHNAFNLPEPDPADRPWIPPSGENVGRYLIHCTLAELEASSHWGVERHSGRGRPHDHREGEPRTDLAGRRLAPQEHIEKSADPQQSQEHPNEDEAD